MDLYVRYGEDNDIRDGRVISDYSSEGPTGNEEIIITRQSDPPLRAGTYFVSLEVRTTGVVAEGTVRAEFDTPLQTGDQIYYFPHLAVGASWQTTITYINYSREEVTCQTDFISDHGTPLMVSFAELGTVDSRTDVLPPGGSVHQETNVELSAPLAPGWARATCSGPVKASLLFRLHNSEGAPTAEAGVNAAAVPATRFVTFAEQGEGQFGTGVAYANPSATAALVTFTARDTAGEVLPSVNRTLSPGGHAAHGMSELFDLTSFTGSIEVTSTEPIVSLSLNFEADPVFSSLPPGETPAGKIPASDVPDLVVQTPSVSDSSPECGGVLHVERDCPQPGQWSFCLYDVALLPLSGRDDFYGRYGSRHRRRGQPYRSRIERPVDQTDCPVDRWNLLLRCLRRSGVRRIPLPGTTAPVP